jgi:peroxiredoxin
MPSTHPAPRSRALAAALAAAALCAGAALAAEGSPAAFLGKEAPAFSLPDTQGKTRSLSEFLSGKGAVLIWVSTRCPVSNAYNGRMAELAKEYQARGLGFVGINSNKEEPVDEIAAHAGENGLGFPILKDAGNVVADQYGASVTPEVYLLDSKGVLRYHGRIDDNMKESAVTARDLRETLDRFLAGQEIARAESKAFGCSIKRVGKAGA